MQDDRLDRTVLVASLGIVGGGLAFLLAMIFLFFPEWMRSNVFAPVSAISVTRTMQERPANLPDDGQEAEIPVSPSGRGLGVAGLSRHFADPVVSTGQDWDERASAGSPPVDGTGAQTSAPVLRPLSPRAEFEFDLGDLSVLQQTLVLATVPPAAPAPGNAPPTAGPAPGNPPPAAGPAPGNSPPTAGPASGSSPSFAGPAPGNSPPSAGPPSGIGGGGQSGGPAAGGGGGKRGPRQT